MEFYPETRTERKLSDDSSFFDLNSPLSQTPTRRFTTDNSYNVYRRPKNRPDSSENSNKTGGVTKTLAKFLLGRKSSQKTESKNSHLERCETISEKTERIKAILERETFESRPRSHSEDVSTVFS